MQSFQQYYQQFLLKSQPQPKGKVYIVASHTGAIVGIEQLTIMHVTPASEPAFQKQYAGRIIIEGSSVEEVRAKLNEAHGL